ncbi:MAG TPA: mechanosensitive ion channel family protein [Polyangiaceae bacterium]|nr:mechanosensitive ion channel family protein [Polyangiaceae bacterium]
MDVLQLLQKFGAREVWLRRGMALVLVVLVLVVLKAVQSLLARRLARFAAKTTSRIDDVLAEMVARTSWLFPLAVSVFVVLGVLPLAPQVERLARGCAIVLFLLQAGIWGSIALRGVIEHQFVAGPDGQGDASRAGVARMAAFAGRVLIWSLLTLVALANLGVDVSALVAGLGVGGVAVALATQNILGDLFASFSILLDKPFVPGDFVIVGDFMGTVEQIGVKTTRIRSLSGEQIVFANNDLLQSRLRNYKRMSERRVSFRLGVTYQTRPDQLRAMPAILRAIVQSQGKTRFDRAHFAEYGDSALLFEVVYYVLDADYNLYMDIHQAINLAIYEQFAAAGVEFAYPTQTLVIQKAAVAGEGAH